jgi:hypothetical protein
MEFLAELFNEFPNLVVNVSHQGITLLRSHDQSGIINNFFPSDSHGLARVFSGSLVYVAWLGPWRPATVL